MLADLQMLIQISLVRMARSNIVPFGCPMGQTIPKLRIEEPEALADRSKTSTENPASFKLLAYARPRIPAPTTMALGWDDGSIGGNGFLFIDLIDND
jgi:hypothetical protein